MKIVGPRASGVSETKKQKKTQAADGSFGNLLSSSDAAASQGDSAVSGATTVAPVNSLLALQMVDDETPKKQAIDHGNRLLDYLDELRHDLLIGKVTAQTAERIVKEIRENSQNIVDPKLKDIINDIELRAAVELAKLGR